MSDPLDVVVRHVDALPETDLLDLITATRAGPASLTSFRTSAGSRAVRSACTALATALESHPALEVAGVLDGLRRARGRERTRIDVMWSGPPSGVTTHRLTAVAIGELIDEARRSVVLVSYAMHSEKSVDAALHHAAARSVDITLLAERSTDNPSFAGSPTPAFPDVPATRLAWPASRREPGAALHAKVLIVDEAVVVIGSANLTQSAMARNLECGLMVRDTSTARAVAAHLGALRQRGTLVRVA